ncbi:MAG: hypothetical protein ACK4ND_13175 [Cytophagaceae bacterium]
MKNYFNHILRLEKGEGGRLIYLVFTGLFLSASILFLTYGSIINFYNKYNQDFLPQILLASGAAGMLVSAIFSKIQSKIAFSNLVYISLAIVTANAFLIYYGMDSSYKDYIGFYALASLIPTFSLVRICFRGIVDRLFDVRESRRMVNKVDLGIWISGLTLSIPAFVIEGNILTNGADWFFYSGLLMFTGLSMTFLLFDRYGFLRRLDTSDQYVSFYNSIFKLVKQKYLIHLGFFSIISSLGLGLLTYLFLYILFLKQATEGFNMVSFLGTTGLILFSISFVVKTFFYNKILNTYGLKITTSVLPVIILILGGIAYGLGVLGAADPAEDTFFLFFLVVVTGLIAAYSFRNAIEEPAFATYFFPIEEELRYDIFVKIDGFLRQFAVFAAGLIAYAWNHYSDFAYINFYWVIAGAIIAWVIVAVRTSVLYRDRLKNTLENEQGTVQKESRSFSFAENLAQGIPFFRGSKLKRSLALLNILDPVSYKKVTLTLLESEDDLAQKIALYETGKLCLLDGIDILERVMSTKYFPISPNAELIRNTYQKLKGSEFRLEKLKYIEQLTFSKIVTERQFGASLTSYSDDSMRSRLFNNLLRDSSQEVRYQAVTSAAGTKNKDIYNNLIEMLDTSLFSNAAVAAMAATGEDILPILETAFHSTGQKEKIQIRIIEIYGKIGTESAVKILSEKLSYPNKNVSKAVLKALTSTGYTVAKSGTLYVNRELEEVSKILVWNMSVYLDLERENASELLLSAMKAEIDNNYNELYKLLALLYDTRSVELVQEKITGKNADESEFASGLLNIILAEELKPMLLPLLNPASLVEKVEKMQDFLPTDPMSKFEVLYNLVNRDYKWVNRWTKACAIKELADEKNSQYVEIFAANMVNPDPLLKEIAAKALFDLGELAFADYLERFKKKYEYSQTLLAGLKPNNADGEEPYLIFDITKFLSSIQEFKSIPGIILSEIAKVIQLKTSVANELVAEFESGNCLDYMIVYKGNIKCRAGEGETCNFEAGEVVSNLEINNFDNGLIQLISLSDSIYYKIPREQLNELINIYDEIPKSLLISSTREVEKHQEELISDF